MSVSTYLTGVAIRSILSGEENRSIQTSIGALQERLTQHFGQDIRQHLLFGSFMRGTILPRNMDANSDIDYMTVFNYNDSQPQAYLGRLKNFVSARYFSSEIKQSYPTIQLELNHIRFELVPAIDNYVFGLQIPERSGTGNWMYTDPTGFNDELNAKDQGCSNMIKPLVRLVKYWNACNGYPYESFDLEKKIVAHSFSVFGFFAPQDLKNYFFEFMSNLSTYPLPQGKAEKVARAQEIIQKVKAREAAGQHALAEQEIQKLIPDPIIYRQRIFG
jgi:hypothetical protein